MGSKVRILDMEPVNAYDRVAAIATLAIAMDGGDLVLRGVAVRRTGNGFTISLPSHRCPARRTQVRVFEPSERLRGEIERVVMERWHGEISPQAVRQP
jgi:DNA-binding cell septation regulator SpoVG